MHARTHLLAHLTRAHNMTITYTRQKPTLIVYKVRTHTDYNFPTSNNYQAGFTRQWPR